MIINDMIDDLHDNISHFRTKRQELKKFKDPKRVKIYSSVILTEEQKNEIDELYVRTYGRKIPYTWHQHFTAFTGRFDARYIPETLYIPEFEKYMNIWGNYSETVSDKNFLTLIAKGAGIRTPRTFLSCSRGTYRDIDNTMINKGKALKTLLQLQGTYFCKPTIDSSSGRGCFVLHTSDYDQNTYVDMIEELGQNFSIQELIICHSDISALYSTSVNTFRIITYNWKGKIYHMPALMRIGRGGGFLDNAHQGGIFVGIDDNGYLCKEAYTEFLDRFDTHPDSNIKFENYQIKLFPKVLEAAYKMHESVPQIGSVNWDFTIDEKGRPILIEANCCGGSIWLSQEANGRAPFGERTEEILTWIGFMNRQPAHKRNKYAFGFNM